MLYGDIMIDATRHDCCGPIATDIPGKLVGDVAATRMLVASPWKRQAGSTKTDCSEKSGTSTPPVVEQQSTLSPEASPCAIIHTVQLPHLQHGLPIEHANFLYPVHNGLRCLHNNSSIPGFRRKKGEQK